MASKPRIPKLCRRKNDNRAYVTDPATHKPKYLGQYGTTEAEENYNRWVRMFLSRDRNSGGLLAGTSITITQLAESYLKWAETYYVKNGKVTSEVCTLKQAIGLLVDLCPDLPIDEIRPSHVKAARDKMVDAEYARGHINDQISRIRRIWRWAVENELVDVSVLHLLASISPLKKGRVPVPEERKIRAVPVEIVLTTLEYLNEMLRDMVLVHLYSGMRAEELVALRPCDVDRSGTPWSFCVRDEDNKKAHLDHERIVPLGPRAREVLIPRIEKAEKPTSWLWESIGRGRHYYRKGSFHFTVNGYRQAIESACKKAGVPHWFPLQLRHTALTLIRAKYGLEGAQVIGGHTSMSTSEIYAEKNMDLARKIAEDMG